jgi:small subunit ribosomal protein S20
MPGFTTGIFICYIREEIHNKNEGNIMPIIKSAKKRVRVAKKASARNSKTKRALKAALKLFGRKADNATHRSAQSSVDKAVKKGIIHKNKAARTKKRLAARAKTAGASVKTHKPAVKKAAPTKAAKRPVKKATVKKSPAKKKAK